MALCTSQEFGQVASLLFEHGFVVSFHVLPQPFLCNGVAL